MSHLILIRHGQSEWNLENRFTGWVDVELAPNGKLEACKAGELLKEKKLKFDLYFSSFQKRAVDTLKLMLNTMRLKEVKIIKAWELNERHYGNLTGLNKDEMKKKFGEEVIHKFRRSWDNPPKPLDKKNPYHPINISAYNTVPREKIPDTESLKNTYERVMPFYKLNVETKLLDNKNIIISAHGNSIRAICKYLFNLNSENITRLEIPTGNPLCIEFDKDLKIKNCKYLDSARSKDLLKF